MDDLYAVSHSGFKLGSSLQTENELKAIDKALFSQQTSRVFNLRFVFGGLCDMVASLKKRLLVVLPPPTAGEGQLLNRCLFRFVYHKSIIDFCTKDKVAT